MPLNREQLVQKQVRPIIEVTLPEGDEVCVRGLTMSETREYNKMCRDQALDGDGSAVLISAWCLVDPDGAPMFDPKKPEDINAINENFLAASIFRIAEAANRLSVAGKNEVEKLLKNYKKTASSSGNSESAKSSE